ncbi:MAG: DUF4982 domain-containing protein, partial [Opitutales bacterium]|nr:DUF4982 domain-containing protein [Opitutales bacterium]
LLLVTPSLHSRTVENFNEGWFFKLGDHDVKGVVKDGLPHSALEVNLPHDWSILGEYSEENPSGMQGAFLPCGIGWYQKSFDWSSEMHGKVVFIEFDGVYMNSEVWINGHYLGKRPYGYIGFSYELTDFLSKGDNRILVRVDNQKVPSGRWYTGSGIYRNVRLVVKDKIHIKQWGTFVRATKIEKNQATLKIDVEIENRSGSDERVSLVTEIFDPNGHRVAVLEDPVMLETDGVLVTQKARIDHPMKWSPDQTNLYLAVCNIMKKGVVQDRFETTFGIRKIEFTTDKGFLLNDKPLLIKGVCNHHDGGPVGAAVPLDVLKYRLELLKKMGCNAIRTAHNPQSPEFYKLCDEMGFLVMDEAFDGWWEPKAAYDYGHYFEEYWRKDLGDLIRRDRNHPSVIIWSIGNEVRGFKEDQQKKMVEFVKALDDTRPVTQGRGYSGRWIDLAGFNGHGEEKGKLERFSKKDPRPVIGTEITHSLQTRGVYRTKTWIRRRDAPAPWEIGKDFKDMEHLVTIVPDFTEEEVFTEENERYQSGYDNAIVRIGVRDDWNRVEKYPWYLGNFRWTGFDYLGESFGWPARTENFGIIDLAGFPKDHYYLYQSLWSDEPMVHLLPHWNHEGKEGVVIPVVVYTNCPTAELFLNGKSLGKRTMTEERQIVWNVPYEIGEIKAVAYPEEGQPLVKAYQTAGKAAKVKLMPNRNSAFANGVDVIRIEASITDEEGKMCPNADDLVAFEISGPAELLAVENGDILDTSPHRVNTRRVFKGKCLLLIQAKKETGTVKIRAVSRGLNADEVEVKIVAEENECI